MIGFLSRVDSNPTKKDISFVHIIASKVDDINVEIRPFALAFARKLNCEKVYLFYGEKGKIIYDCPL